jgi:hypothetical protein
VFPSDVVGVKVRSLQAALTELCAELDPDLIPLSEAPGIWSCFDRIERLAAGAKGRLARKVEESRAWQAEGDRSAADWMARRSGTSSGRARAELETSKRLAGLGATDKAVARGVLSAQQAEAVADAASADPTAEQHLLGTAQRGSLRDLKHACQRTKARVEDDHARARRLYEQRAARTWTGADEAWNLHVRNAPEVGAQIEAVLRAETERIFTDARVQGRRVPLEAYRADALSPRSCWARTRAAAAVRRPARTTWPPRRGGRSPLAVRPLTLAVTSLQTPRPTALRAQTPISTSTLLTASAMPRRRPAHLTGLPGALAGPTPR